MKRFFIVVTAFVVTLTVCAQQAKDEIMQNQCLSASNYLAYRARSSKGSHSGSKRL